jgi:hypothetical protein
MSFLKDFCDKNTTIFPLTPKVLPLDIVDCQQVKFAFFNQTYLNENKKFIAEI